MEGSENIDFVVLYNFKADRFAAYPYQLPYSLNLGMVNSEVVKIFGDTKDKGGGSLPIWVRYEHLGIEFTFESNIWDKTDNAINHIKLFKR